MTALVYLLVIGLAAITMVGVMYLVLREKHEDDAHLKYRRSPWDEAVAPTQPDSAPDTTVAEHPADTEVAEVAEVVEPVIGANPGDHVPLAEPETEAEKPETTA